MQLPLLDRFLARVNKSDGCWIWTGIMMPNGYGVIARAGHGSKNVYAHRLSWEIHKGPIPAGLLVCHTCDVRNCVNPDHLFLGTSTDNNRDTAKKGRHVGARKLAPADVELIRRDRPQGERAQMIYARVYGVTRRTINNIVRYGWKSLGHHSTKSEKIADVLVDRR